MRSAERAGPRDTPSPAGDVIVERLLAVRTRSLKEGTAMIVRMMGSLFAPKYPRFYTGRHRAPMRRFVPRPRVVTE
jgi:hypothetical protein